VTRWLRSLQAQLLLWAVLPVTFALLALAFTGVYAHQQAMRDFVAERDLALARLTARIVEDGLAHGTIAPDGSGLMAWLLPLVGPSVDRATLVVIDGEGRALFHPDPQRLGADLSEAPGVAEARAGREGFVLAEGPEGPRLVAFAPLRGANWAVLVEEPVEGLIGPILRLSGLAPIVAVAAGLVSLLVLTFGWTTIVRPLRSLAQAAGQVSWGDDSAVARPVGGVQEVQDLHRALTEMMERIRGYEAGMRDYLGAVARGQEEERARLARELHDGPVQALIALGQQAEMARRLLARGEVEQATALIETLRQWGMETMDELRRLIAALRPAYLEDLGFLPALEALVREAADRTGARVELIQEGPVPRADPEVELAAYRIAQEALTNALQHARAQRITARVRGDEEGLFLTVEDDGVGFTLPPRPDLLTRQGRFGLVGMQERATRLGGRLTIETASGRGTRIAVWLPAHPPAA
jgi:signal transduction histidine kinase